jgi:hypothetical protein
MADLSGRIAALDALFRAQPTASIKELLAAAVPYATSLLVFCCMQET